MDKDNTTIVEGCWRQISNRCSCAIDQNQIADTTSDFDREKLQERLARNCRRCAVIKVGAPTETELKELKLRIEELH